jgi:hypothetical protein
MNKNYLYGLVISLGIFIGLAYTQKKNSLSSKESPKIENQIQNQEDPFKPDENKKDSTDQGEKEKNTEEETDGQAKTEN